MHWAAKLGNTQLLEALMFSGGKVDIKSVSFIDCMCVCVCLSVIYSMFVLL